MKKKTIIQILTEEASIPRTSDLPCTVIKDTDFNCKKCPIALIGYSCLNDESKTRSKELLRVADIVKNCNIPAIFNDDNQIKLLLNEKLILTEPLIELGHE
jgi:hypothetical protein